MASDSMQNSMQHYKNMRDSGVEWIGVVPSDWKLSTIGSVYQLRNTKVSDTDYPPLSVTMNGVVPQLATAAKTDAHDARKLVKSGDFVINSRSDRRGSCGISPYTGSVSLINTVLEPREKMNAQYYDWLFHTIQFADEFYKNGHGIVDDLWTTGWQEMKRIIIPMPSLDIQEKIAVFLNKKCDQIDSTISQSKTSIEEYKAWKSSIIYEAVTHGLDSNAEMKDSGIEWIGEIPAHWSIGKVKQVSEFAPKCDFSHLNHDSLITFTPMECIRNGCFENRSAKFDTITGSYTQYAEGDIVLAKVTPCFENGNICIMKDLFSGLGLGSSELFVLRAHSILTEYLFYYLQNPGFVQRACASMTGTGGLKRVSSDFVKNCPVPIPPKDEQDKIASFLNKRCNAIDALIKEKNNLIEDLESYKKSLIYEVVTGKRKVV